MGIEISFLHDMQIYSVSIYNNFNDKIIKLEPMTLNNDKWIYNNNNICCGEYIYKFLVNNQIQLNDPYAAAYLVNEANEIWSYLRINKDGNRMFSSIQKKLNIAEFILCSSVTEIENIVPRTAFNVNIDKKAVVRLSFDLVVGLHAVTVAWYNPRGQLYEWTENSLEKPEGYLDKYINLWFWVDLNNDMIQGIWTLRLFIDGKYIAQKNIEIKKALTYNGYNI